jgi:serine protease Do
MAFAQDEAHLLDVQKRVQSALPQARKALVCIECSGATASGVIISADGLVLTAAHVTGGAKKKVKIVLSDGKTVEATSLGLDTSTDAAMVQLPKPAKEWPHVSISHELAALAPGQWCFDLGHPGGWDKARGSVVRIGRLVKTSSNTLQSDCIMMGGDSGGPLFNLEGDVIGINSMIWSGSDQNLHVSMAPFLRSWDAMKRGETITTWAQGGGGWIGLSTQSAEDGLRIGAIAKDSPAMKAGLREGDLILKANNKKLAAPADFSEMIRNHTVGQIVTLLVKSLQGQRVVEVKLAQRPQE